MALNWNIEKVRDYKEVQAEGESIITDTLIGLTVAVGMRQITEANYKEFYARTHLLELLHGTYTRKDHKVHFITLEEVERRIGLSTNASTFTRAQFIKLKVGRYFKELIED